MKVIQSLNKDGRQEESSTGEREGGREGAGSVGLAQALTKGRCQHLWVPAGACGLSEPAGLSACTRCFLVRRSCVPLWGVLTLGHCC